MRVRWQRRARVFVPAGQRPWCTTHAALPIADHVEGDRYRVYVSGRDDRNRAHIGFFEFGLAAPGDLLRLSDAPVLSPGRLGTFDDAGVTGSCLVVHEGLTHLYYTGWSLGSTVPFYLFVGLAVSEDGGTSFRRVSESPLLDRDPVDPYLTASPWVLVEDRRWRMWYVSGTAWTPGVPPQHHYHIKYAESADGIHWTREGRVAIDYGGPEEYAIARPCVLKQGGRYRMWFSARGQAYRLGYAESGDGQSWVRQDADCGLVPSENEWDSDMIAYPVVFEGSGRLHMLYNGNGYGRTGVGYAVESRD
jgi:hypothetical protein